VEGIIYDYVLHNILSPIDRKNDLFIIAIAPRNICDESVYYYDQFQLNIKGLYFWVCLGRTCGIAGAGVSMAVSSITYMIGIILMTPLAKLFCN